MRNVRTFKKWLELGEPEHLVKSNIYVEDISGKLLEILISNKFILDDSKITNLLLVGILLKLNVT